MQKRIYAAGAGEGRIGFIAEILVCTLLTAGITGILCAFANSLAANIFILIESVVMSVVIAFVRRKPVVSHIFHASAVIIFALNILFAFGAVQNAMISSMNSVIGSVNNAFNKDIALLGAEPASTGSLILFFGILTAIVAMAVSFLVSRRAVTALMTVSFLLLVAELVLKLPFGTILMLMLFVGSIGCWSICISGGGMSVLIISAVLALITAAGAIICSEVGFEGFKVLNDLHEDFSSKVYSMRYGNDSLPHGDLAKAKTMLSSGNKTLLVSFDKPESMYLKGFTGSIFENNEWKECYSESYRGEWNGMLDYLDEGNFNVQNMFGEYSIADGEKIKYNTVNIVNNGADRSYVYLPFTVQEAEGKSMKSFRDLYTKSRGILGTSSYSFNNIETGTKPELLNPESWVNGDGKLSEEKRGYIEMENVYRAFARDTYLELDDLTRAEVNEVFFKNFDAQSENVGVYTITSRIRSILSLVTEYTESPSEPQDKDFIGWFLGSYKKGNAPYYATAAVMAYRAAGIPARYVEGYYISDSDVNDMNTTNMRNIQLTERNSHAWVEIYRDGLGWVSVDVTPGFYTEDLSMEQIIDISKNIGDIGGVNGRGSEHYTNRLSMYSPEKADKSDRMSSGMRILFAVLLLLIIVAAVMHFRFIYLTYKKYDKTYGPTKPDTTNRMMAYICAALKADGISANPDHADSFKSELLEKYPDFSPKEFDRVISLLRRSSYGGARLREHELRTIRIFMEKLYKNVYANKTLFQKFVMKYIKII